MLSIWKLLGKWRSWVWVICTLLIHVFSGGLIGTNCATLAVIVVVNVMGWNKNGLFFR